MLASKLSYELSVRLGDVIHPETPDQQGQVFSGAQRLKYLSRAYSKLTRMLKILMRDYQPEFNKRREVKVIAISKADVIDIIPIDTNIKIDELYVTYEYTDGTKKTKTVPATYMEPSLYLTNKYNPNDVKSVSFIEGQIKYTLMVSQGKSTVYLLPKSTMENKYTKLEYLEVPDFELSSWEDDILITADYIDLLIDLAAIQGMQDIARADKAQLISQSIQADWQILGQYGSYMKQTEGVQE
jgi:hypothetical protein